MSFKTSKVYDRLNCEVLSDMAVFNLAKDIGSDDIVKGGLSRKKYRKFI